jgi:hypothetical protein
MRLFESNFNNFNGKEKEFIFVDLDNNKIISSQSCFRITNLPHDKLKVLFKRFKVEES